MSSAFCKNIFNPIALRKAKTLLSFGLSECNGLKVTSVQSEANLKFFFVQYLSKSYTLQKIFMFDSTEKTLVSGYSICFLFAKETKMIDIMGIQNSWGTA